MIQRLLGVLKLNVNTYEEIEADESATMEAGIVVTIVAVLSAIGAFIGAQAAGAALDQLGDFDIPIEIPTFSPLGAALNALIGAFVLWLLWSALTFFIGTKMFGADATLGEMLRVIGYAQAPRVLGVLSFIPCLGLILVIVSVIWSLVAGFIAIRQGLDLDNGKTAITIVLSWLAAILVNWLVLGPIFRLLT
jgi:hypothetical protein